MDRWPRLRRKPCLIYMSELAHEGQDRHISKFGSRAEEPRACAKLSLKLGDKGAGLGALCEGVAVLIAGCVLAAVERGLEGAVAFGDQRVAKRRHSQQVFRV